MKVQLNKNFTVSFVVTNSSGALVDNDNPVVVIQNKSTGAYYNGIQWRTERCEIYMQHSSAGTYAYTFCPDTLGELSVTTISKNYLEVKERTYTVVESIDDSVMSWPVEKEHRISIQIADISESAMCTILNMTDDTYFDGDHEIWRKSVYQINMIRDITQNIFFFDFTPNTLGDYYIQIQSSSGQNVAYVLRADDIEDVTFPVIINSLSFLCNDNTNSRVCSPLGDPIKGVNVLCYDLNASGKPVIAKAVTDSNGEWSMTVPAGRYYFMFEKDGYIDKGFEREVQ